MRQNSDNLIEKEKVSGPFLNSSSFTTGEIALLKGPAIEGEVSDSKSTISFEINKFIDFLKKDNQRSRFRDYLTMDNDGYPLFWDPKINNLVRIELWDKEEGPAKILSYGFILRKENFISDLVEFSTEIYKSINESMMKEVIRATREKQKIRVVFDLKVFYSPGEKITRALSLEVNAENECLGNYQEEIFKTRNLMEKDVKENPQWTILGKVLRGYDRFLRNMNTTVYNKKVSPGIIKEEKNKVKFYLDKIFFLLEAILGDTFSGPGTSHLWTKTKRPKKPLSLSHWARSQPESKESKQKDARMNFNSNLYFLVEEHKNMAENYLEEFRANKGKEKRKKGKKKIVVLKKESREEINP